MKAVTAKRFEETLLLLLRHLTLLCHVIHFVLSPANCASVTFALGAQSSLPEQAALKRQSLAQIESCSLLTLRLQ